MKTIPILFTTEMVQAILDGRKGMTRMVVKLQPPICDCNDGKDYNDRLFGVDYDGCMGEPAWYASWENKESIHNVKFPFGIIDSILWVKETYRSIEQDTGEFRYEYKASEQINLTDKWKSSCFMPRVAARIFLKVTDIRVERLQDISEEDAVKEGVQSGIPISDMQYLKGSNFLIPSPFLEHMFAFLVLWAKINGVKSWDANPWVWVISFERCEMPEGFTTETLRTRRVTKKVCKNEVSEWGSKFEQLANKEEKL